MKKHILFSLILIFLLASLCIITNIPAFAANTEESIQINVTVPLILPVNVDAFGNVTTANDVAITNNSEFGVYIESIKIDSSNGWKLVDSNYNFNKEPIGQNSFTFQINDTMADTEGNINIEQWHIDKKSSSLFEYDCDISPQTSPLTHVVIGTVMFEIDWDGYWTVNFELPDGTTKSTQMKNPSTAGWTWGTPSYTPSQGYMKATFDHWEETSRSNENKTITYKAVFNITNNYQEIAITSTNRYELGYTDGDTSFNIPDYFYNSSKSIWYKITSIGSEAFKGCTSLKTVEIPNTVISIADSAFNGCTALSSISIPNSVTQISDYAFRGCESLTNITIPTNVTIIGSSAFRSCTNLIEIIIPNSVITIGDSAFNDCTALAKVVLPNNLTTISEYTFRGCIKLTDIEIPSKVTTIASSAFRQCTALDKIEIPNSVTLIGDSAFNGCSGLKNVILSNNITTIDEYEFAYCTSLENITVPEGVTTISSSAFTGCTLLEYIVLPYSLQTINDKAFYNCPNINAVYYAGESKTQINIGLSNTSLTGAQWYYGSSGPNDIKKEITPEATNDIESESPYIDEPTIEQSSPSNSLDSSLDDTDITNTDPQIPDNNSQNSRPEDCKDEKEQEENNEKHEQVITENAQLPHEPQEILEQEIAEEEEISENTKESDSFKDDTDF